MSTDTDHEATIRAHAETYLGLIAASTDCARTDPRAWVRACAQQQAAYHTVRTLIGLPADTSVAAFCQTLLALQAEPEPPTAAVLAADWARGQAMMQAGGDRLIHPRPLEEFRAAQGLTLVAFARRLGLTLDDYRTIQHAQHATPQAVQRQICARLAEPQHAITEFDPFRDPVVVDRIMAELALSSADDVMYVLENGTFVPLPHAAVHETMSEDTTASEEETR